MSLNFILGDALCPQGAGNKIIAHICNNAGAWGGGFTAYLSAKWLTPEITYRNMKSRKLGLVELIQVENDVWIANMIGQVFNNDHGPPIRYKAVRDALRHLACEALSLHASVHMPRIGCGLAGGNWSQIEPIIRAELVAVGVNVHVYDLKS